MKKIQNEKINMINVRYLKRGKKKLGGGEESYEYNRINKKWRGIFKRLLR